MDGNRDSRNLINYDYKQQPCRYDWQAQVIFLFSVKSGPQKLRAEMRNLRPGNSPEENYYTDASGGWSGDVCYAGTHSHGS